MMLKFYIRNVFGVPLVSKKRKDRLLSIRKEILSLKPDIIFLQEIFFKKDLKIFDILLAEYSIFRNKRHLFDLGGGLVSFIRKDMEYEASYMLYKKSGFLTDLSIVDRFASKGFQIIKILNKEQIFTFIHTHLTCPYEQLNKNSMEKLITNQLSSLTYFINSLSTPLCLCGDLNLEPDNKLLRDFIVKNNLRDDSKDIEKTYIGNFYTPKWLFSTSTKSQKIDYILSKNIQEQFEVLSLNDEDFKSDHKALIASIRL